MYVEGGGVRGKFNFSCLRFELSFYSFGTGSVWSGFLKKVPDIFRWKKLHCCMLSYSFLSKKDKNNSELLFFVIILKDNLSFFHFEFEYFELKYKVWVGFQININESFWLTIWPPKDTTTDATEYLCRLSDINVPLSFRRSWYGRSWSHPREKNSFVNFMLLWELILPLKSNEKVCNWPQNYKK